MLHWRTVIVHAGPIVGRVQEDIEGHAVRLLVGVGALDDLRHTLDATFEDVAHPLARLKSCVVHSSDFPSSFFVWNLSDRHQKC